MGERKCLHSHTDSGHPLCMHNGAYFRVGMSLHHEQYVVTILVKIKLSLKKLF